MSDTPRVYVACLAAYNNGKLHGKWVDAVDADAIQACIKEVLASSPEPDAEEYAFHDYEGFGELRLGEWPDVEKLAKLGALIEEHGELFLALHGHLCNDDPADTATYLEEEYQGEWESLGRWAENYFDDTGMLKEVPESLRCYIDFEKWADDCEMGGDIFTIELGGMTHVFNNR